MWWGGRPAPQTHVQQQQCVTNFPAPDASKFAIKKKWFDVSNEASLGTRRFPPPATTVCVSGAEGLLEAQPRRFQEGGEAAGSAPLESSSVSGEIAGVWNFRATLVAKSVPAGRGRLGGDAAERGTRVDRDGHGEKGGGGSSSFIETFVTLT